MSKKKPISRSTMTLKDFHGGSIPSDLPLPSAPGVNGRSLDRPGFDRYSSWGNPIGRFDSHLRPLSSLRNFDDKAPFLSAASRIGRTFDEDERKPLEAASSTPRRTVSDDSFYLSSSRVDLKPDSYFSKFTQTSNSAGASSVLPSQLKQISRFQGASMAVGISKDPPVGSGQTAIRPQQQNAWAVRKEAAENAEMASSLLSGPSISSKLAQASALEKISSGRWQSKQTLQYHADVEVIHHENEPVSDFPQRGTGYNVYTRLEIPAVRDQLGTTPVDGQMNKSLFVDGLRWSSSKDSSNNEIYGSSTVPKFQQSVGDGMVARPPFSALASDVSERPKLKLLPRTKPIESWELPRVKQFVLDQGYPVSEEVVFGAHENIGIPGTELRAIEKANQLPERPKLNLKPRSQQVDQIEGIAENRRNTLFGGARPRELVLRDRVAEDVNPSGKAEWERERSSDTWRRAAEQQLRPWSPQEKPGFALRHGKVASPAELAQSFSRSISDPNRPPSGPLPDPAHPVLFSRLVGPTTRRSSINGY